MIKDLYFSALQYTEIYPFLVPLGIIGVWRWSVWLLKEIVALNYKPTTGTYKSAVSIVTPVYNETPSVFKKALLSWQKNNPLEIIAVIDYTDKTCIAVFKEFAKKYKKAKLIITKTPGKRPALALGIKKAKSPIVALVDSDTIWDKDVLKNGIIPFKNAEIAGVATYQSVLNPKTIAQKIFDTQLDLRYNDEFPFLAVGGNVLNCLSGRTAFYRKKVIVPMLSSLVNEKFNGKMMISGDDKSLTYLVLKAGHKVAYQGNSHVYTPGMEGLHQYFRQRLRWSRNELRAGIKAIREGWIFQYKLLVFFQFDKIAQAFVVILSPIYFFLALLSSHFGEAGIIFLWWTISRAIKMYPHLKRRPQDIIILPAFILSTFITGIVKVYAFFTLNTQGWITRWHSSRMKKFRFAQLAPAYAATGFVFLCMVSGVSIYKELTYFTPRREQARLVQKTLTAPPNKLSEDTNTVEIYKNRNQKDLRVTKYIMQEGDTISAVAQKYGISADNLLLSNVSRLTNWNTVEPGFILSIPGKDIQLSQSSVFNYERIYPDVLQTSYDPQTNTITVSGRGKYTTLSDIRSSVGSEYLDEISPRVWFLKANLSIRSGVSLDLSSNEVTWLKMQSTPKNQVNIQAYNGTITIKGVKITSWDEEKDTYDTNIEDKRSYILVKNGSRMEIYDSELSYLGYSRELSPETSPYGVSWRMPPQNYSSSLLTGEVINSKFHHNYFGVYTFGATGMLWRGNEFYENIRYGFDPHDDSNGFLIENNIAHNNGTHGFIISKRCMYNTFRNNISYNNKLHGIMLHEGSSNNILENNTIYGNRDGIAIWHSSNNLITNNTLYNNERGVRANAGSVKNHVSKNTIYGSSDYGVYLYKNSDSNTFTKNTLYDNAVAFYIKTESNVISQNTIRDNTIGVYLLETASKNVIANNTLIYHTQDGIYTKLSDSSKNYIKENYLSHNRRDIFAQKKVVSITAKN